MSSGVDLSQFYDMFFDEAEELLADMERLLLALDLDAPNPDELNGIFRAAHSIKGGAGTFGCFEVLADTTHLLENILDDVRNGDLALHKGMIDVFLEAKDVLQAQVHAYREGNEPDKAAYEHICTQLRGLTTINADASQHINDEPLAAPAQSSPTDSQAQNGETQLIRVVLKNLSAQDASALEGEMAIMGTVLKKDTAAGTVTLWVDTTASVEDIEAVCGFIVNPDQLDVSLDHALSGPAAEPAPSPQSASSAKHPEATHSTPRETPSKPATSATTGQSAASSAAMAPATSNTLRVGVEKVDQIINLVGELVITQAMLVQTVGGMDPVVHARLVNGIEQLERNARDLQEAVMSIRMMPMDYVFSRFPRLVRESAAALGKNIRLITEGQATELDKSLIERIIDPLTHLVRNSIDHGIEGPDERLRVDKDPEGVLTLSAEHSGGHIIIQVSDDGAGLNRDRILAKAIRQGFPVNDQTPDDELWQLIFAPGFSTAEQVTAISGRGVGMDVVRRNIIGMGGHVHVSSTAGKGTVTRIVLPLTLAILDGMSVSVGQETFILPLSHVMESLQPVSDQIRELSGDERLLYVRGDYLPLVALHDIFDVAGAETDPTRAIAVILKAEEVRFALLVDHLVGQHQVVVKNLEANYRKVPGVSAATILGDGSVALIVDVFALMRLTQTRHGQALDAPSV